ncbi:hypothetical protein CRG98_010192 [Punica granatum]|uniref:Uncharacterized protein n=1 Tax=Punica granatum TaxID=22663 RepID=A0A2I0KLM5_PUNGR|nr:hypothetical protein CRG98_010192 [Punica granatum]
MAIQAELANLRAERVRLRQEVAEKNEQLGDQHQLQKELAQARAQLQRRDQELAQANAALDRIFLHRNSHTYGIQVLTTGGAPPVSHTLPIKNGRGKSTHYLRGEYTTDASSFSTAHDERATTTYHYRHATSTSWDSHGPSPTTDFNKHVTTAGIRTTTTWTLAATIEVRAVVGDSSTTACP